MRRRRPAFAKATASAKAPAVETAGEEKESPDVETPGLLVKALISSFFISKVVAYLKIFEPCLQI